MATVTTDKAPKLSKLNQIVDYYYNHNNEELIRESLLDQEDRCRLYAHLSRYFSDTVKHASVVRRLLTIDDFSDGSNPIYDSSPDHTIVIWDKDDHVVTLSGVNKFMLPIHPIAFYETETLNKSEKSKSIGESKTSLLKAIVNKEENIFLTLLNHSATDTIPYQDLVSSKFKRDYILLQDSSIKNKYIEVYPDVYRINPNEGISYLYPKCGSGVINTVLDSDILDAPDIITRSMGFCVYSFIGMALINPQDIYKVV